MSDPRRVIGQPAQDSYALARLAELYPPPLVVRSGRVAPSGEYVYARYLLLPGQRRPRILVPAGERVAAARAATRQLSGRRTRTRLARRIVAGAVWSGALEVVPALQATVTGPRYAPSIETILLRCLGGEHPLLTMPVGPARANRKPVLQVTDRSGRVRAFVKIGHDQLTRSLVRREASALRGLDRSVLTTTRAPEVIELLEWNDLTVLVLTPLPLPARRQRGEGARQALLTTVQEIGALTGQPATPQDISPFHAGLHEQLRGCGERGEPLLRHLGALDRPCPPIRLAPWHGDLNPGNLAVGPSETLVWDWERFDAAVPFGFDLLHHALARAITVRGEDAGGAAVALLLSAPEMLAPLGVPRAAADVTARLYLLTLSARYLHDQQDAAGAVLGRVEEWILPALDGDRPETKDLR